MQKLRFTAWSVYCHIRRWLIISIIINFLHLYRQVSSAGRNNCLSVARKCNLAFRRYRSGVILQNTYRAVCRRIVLGLFVALVCSLGFIYLYAGERNAQAAESTTINFQARVLQANGAVIADGNQSVEFRLYTQSSGGASVWNETQSVSSKNGYVTVALGSSSAFPGTIDWSQELWLTLNVNGDGEMNPRMKLTAVPYAFRAKQATLLTNGSGTIGADGLVQLGQPSMQNASSSGALIRLNQQGSGGLLQLQSGGSDRAVLSNSGDLTLSGGIILGNNTGTTAGTIRWTGSDFEGYNGSAWKSFTNGSAAGGMLVNKVKPADETVNNSAVLQDDDHLNFPIGANEEYTYRFVIQANSGATPDLRFAVTAPAGATCRVSFSDPEGATAAGQIGCGVSTVSIPGNGAVDLYEITGSVTNGATPGTVRLQWAQFTANASNTIVYAGSYVQAIRSIGAGSSGQPFVQSGNAFGQTAVLGTTDSNDLQLITNGSPRLVIGATGNVGIGDTTPTALFTVGTNDALRVNTSGDVSTNGLLDVTGRITARGNIVAAGSASGVTATTENVTRTNVTTITLTGAAFANNDILYINNAGQDYFTRIVSGGGTAVLTVSPAVSYDASATVERYSAQNIGATTTDYTTRANRFFQGYFLGGVVIGAGSTTISDGNITSTTDLVLQSNGGIVSLGGALQVNGTISGDGAGLTNIQASQISGSLPTLDGSALTGLNASNIGTGTLADARLSSNVTLQGNSFNGLNQLVQLDGSGALPALNGAALTSLNASNVASGTLADGRLSSNVTLLGNTFNGASQLVQLDGSGALPALSGTALTNLNAGSLSGALPALNGSALTSLNASNITSGTLADARLSANVTVMGNTFNGASQLVQLNGSGALPALNGSALISLSASSISSGTLSDSRLSANVTLAGNSFNGANGLVQLNGTGALPALSGAALTGLNASNVTSGTLADARLSANVTVMGNTFNGASQLVQLNGSGALPALDGSGLTSLSAANIASGTLNDSRLSANVGLVNVSRSFTASQTFGANIILGTDTVSPTAGQIALNDSVGSNGFTNVLGTNSLTANRAINLPDASGTICLTNSTGCGFTLFASASAQIDNSTNNSIFINKTNGTGDLLTLQRGGTTKFAIANDGSGVFSLDATGAFVVRTAGGNNILTVNTTNGLVQIGNTTVDGTGTLLVLDTKNTAGDPSGQNGAMYYNSVETRNRCYENGYWSDCTSSRVQADTTLATAGTTINLTLAGNETNLVCRLSTTGRSANSLVYMRFNNVSSSGAYAYNVLQNLTGATNNTSAQSSASATQIVLNGNASSTNPGVYTININNFATSNKTVDWTGAGSDGTGVIPNNYKGSATYFNTSSAITSVQFITSTGNFNAGTRAWCDGR